ncbi:MAG: hypothetical protein QG597_3439 [Actinomycetota bacterium]|nr:hypothetical protein [Actinomycetota bacterium]
MARASAATARRSFGAAFDPRANSLNLLRLVFAFVVLLDHCSFLGGFGANDIGHASTPGTLAVYGFFAISGFLIARSAATSRPGRYLRKRFLRIFPAYWAVLVVTALMIAPIGYLRGVRPAGCGLDCYLAGPDGPVGYVLRNLSLWVVQQDISGTPTGVHLPEVWNGSLWTLAYEFGAYLVLLGLALAGALRRPPVVLALTTGLLVVLGVFTIVPTLNENVNAFTQPVFTPALVLLPLFLTGSCLWLYRERVPDSGWLAGGLFASAIIVMALPIGAQVPGYSFTTGGLAAPLLVYPVLWLGFHLPFVQVGRRHDLSYGVYLYAFPVQQALAMMGVPARGLLAYTVVTTAVVLVFAAGSWFLIERPAMQLGRNRPVSATSGPTHAVPGPNAPADC